MNISDRDINIINRIVEYINEIQATVEYFGDNPDIFIKNNIYRNAVSMCILQIGELSAVLSDEFKDYYDDIPWRNIKGMRNIMAHKYGNIDKFIVWEAIKADIPDLEKFCLEILKS